MVGIVTGLQAKFRVLIPFQVEAQNLPLPKTVQTGSTNQLTALFAGYRLFFPRE